MSFFREAELRYLAGGPQLGRVATVGADGTPHVVPVGWTYNAVRDTARDRDPRAVAQPAVAQPVAV